MEKLLHRIEDVKEALARRKDAAAKEAFEEVRKAEQMFLDALAEKGLRFEGGKIIGAGEEDENSVRDDVDKGADSLYNIKQSKPYKYSKEQYTRWAWTRANDIISFRQMEDFFSKWQEGRPAKKFDVSYNNEYIVPVCNQNNEGFAIDNHLIYAVGTAAKPDIRKVVRINMDNATDIETIREVYVYYEKRSPYEAVDYVESVYGEGTIDVFLRDDMPDYREYSEEIRRQASGTFGGTDNGNNRKPSNGRGNADGDSESRGGGNGVKKSRKTVTATPPEVDHLTPMQKQTVANHTRAKVYTKAEALAVVEDMAHFMDENYGFDGGMGEASGFVTLTKTVKDAQSLFSFFAKIHPNKKTNRNKKRVIKNKFPILENNIPKPLDKFQRMVYNDANERNQTPPCGIRRNRHGNQIQETHYPPCDL